MPPTHDPTSSPPVAERGWYLSCVDLLLRLRLPLLGCCLLAALVCYGPSRRLEFDRSLEGLFTEGDPRLTRYLEGKSLFGGAEVAAVAYTDPELLTPAGLERLEAFTLQFQDLEGVERVLSLAQLRLPGAPLSTLTLREQLDTERLTESSLRDELLGCDLYRGRLLSADGRTTVLLVTLAPPTNNVNLRLETIETMRKLCAAHDPPAMLAGGPILVNDVYDHLEKDGKTLGLASTLVLALVIAILFANLRWIVLPLAVVHLTLLVTQALLFTFGTRLSMVSSPLVALVTVIGTATVVHVAIRFREDRQRHPPLAALRQTLYHIGPAIFWTCLTTAAGFSSLLASRVSPVGAFGGMMTLGALTVFVATLGLLPAGVLLGRIGTDPARAPGERYMATTLLWLVSAAEHRPGRVAVVIMGILAISSIGILRLEVGTDFDENFRSSSPIVQSYHFIRSRMETTETVDLLIDVPTEPQSDMQPFLESIQQLQSELQQLPGVVGTLSIIDTLDFMTGTRRERVDLTNWLAALGLQNTSYSQRLQLLHLVEPQLVSSFWNREHKVMRITVQTGQLRGTRAKLELIDAIEQTAQKAFPTARTSGVAILLTYFVKSLLADQWITFALAVAAIIGMLILAFRDWRLGLIALLPNAVPIIMVVGVMGWCGMKVNVATAMLASVSMGLSADFSIHYLYRFQQELRTGVGFGTALRNAHASVGLAMVLANIALIAGFTTLVVSAFVPTVHFGLLVSVAMLGGLIGNLTVLPILLTRLHRPGPTRHSLPPPSGPS